MQARHILCESCRRLLAVVEHGRMTIRRGGMQATFDGDFLASLVCYGARCRTLNVVRVERDNDERRGRAED